MKPYIANANFPSPQTGVNRQVVKVPDGFQVERIVAYIPQTSVMDIRENGSSLFGQNPVGGGVFTTANRKLDFPVPYNCQTTDLEVIVDCGSAAPSSPMHIAIIGTYGGE
jgi:hypothetical protein